MLTIGEHKARNCWAISASLHCKSATKERRSVYSSPHNFLYEKEKGNCAFVILYGGQHLSRRKKLINNTDIPQHQIEAIARCIMPDILAFYESEEGQREFAEWKAQRDAEHRETKKE